MIVIHQQLKRGDRFSTLLVALRLELTPYYIGLFEEFKDVLSAEPKVSEREELPEHIAAIDLGSNSFHMVVARIQHGEVRTLDRLGEKVQLASGLNKKGELSEASQQRALECLRRFKQRIKELDSSSVQIVATNAVREARNRKQFIRRAEVVMGSPIEIVSGREEARLIYLGVAHTLADDLGCRLVIDIGGGSTEFIIGERFEPQLLESLHMGCVSYRDRFFSNGLITEAAMNRAQTTAAQEILNIKQQFGARGWDSCAGASGSIKAVFTAVQAMGLSDEVLTPTHMEALRQRMIELGHVSRLSEIGIKKDRQSIFPAGMIILHASFVELGIKEMIMANGALREGLLYDMIGRKRHEDVRERTISSMQKRYDVDVRHAHEVELTVLHAWTQVCKQWELDTPYDEQLLVWAARTFEVGMMIAHSQYHRHGAYLVRYSELPGFTKLTQLHLSTIIRQHRRKIDLEYFNEMKDSERARLLKLCILFRLAVILTAARNSEETSFTFKVSRNQMALDMGQGWLAQHPLTLANLENEKEYLKKVGYSLVVR
jgi:exopolyphosphatase/guanosine-5'-triphosphate,3'-diphosphate pyrophosphatase